MSILIKGGRIITAADDYVADVFIEDGAISMIGRSLDVSAERTIDATGKIVMPGAIDPHTHIEMFFGGTTTCDDFTSGTTAAAFGGTTTLIDFCVQTPGDTFAEALAKYHEKIERCPPVIDVGFHIAVTDLHTGGTLEDLAKLPDEGVTSYKLFMAYKGAVMVDDETLFKVMQVAHETGALVMVHAENGDAIDIIVKETVAAGNTDPVWHARSRPMETEAEATNRAIQLARVADAPLYVVHVSCQPSVEPIALAREKGWRVWGETLHPVPLRRRVDDGGTELGRCEVHLHAAAEAARSTRSTSGRRSGRTPSRPSRPTTARSTGPSRRGSTAASSRSSRTGARESRTGCTCSGRSASRTGRITPNRFVELVSTNIAKLFGLYPRKGTIAPGSDADIVIWDPNKKLTISAATHHTNVNYNLFEGTEVTGAPEVVLVRGQVIVENDELVAEARCGAVRQAGALRRGAPADPVGGGRDVSDEAAREVYAEGGARAGGHARGAPRDPRDRFLVRVHRPGVPARLRPDARRWRRPGACSTPPATKGLPVVFTTIAFEPSLKDGGLWMQKVPALGGPPARRPLGGDRSSTRPAEDETVLVKKGASGLLRHQPRLRAGLPGRRLGDPVRRDHERLHPRDRGRPAAVRLADDRAARVRRRPGAGAARRKPVRHPGEVRGRRLAGGRARLPRGRAREGGYRGLSYRVALLAGDGVGAEVTVEARRVVDALASSAAVDGASLGLGVLPRARADDARGLGRRPAPHTTPC